MRSTRHPHTMKPLDLTHVSGPAQGKERGGFAAMSAAVCAFLLTTPAAFTQSATNFQAAAPSDAAASEQPAQAMALDIATPSRLVPTKEIVAYVGSVSSVFSMRERETDPFGQYQDPAAKPIIKRTQTRPNRPTQVQTTPFADIVRMIVISTIMPGEKRFLIGARIVAQGDTLPLNFRGKQIQAQITEVTSRQIGFRDLETGETAARKFDMLPAGMSMGSSGVSTPGMVRERSDAPINLDAGSQ